MWINLSIVPSPQKVITVAPGLARLLKSKCTVIFGGRTQRVKVKPSDALTYDEHATFDTPMTIVLTCALRDKLLIPETQVYRMKAVGNKIILGPVIGLLLGIHSHEYTPRHMKKYTDRFSVYPRLGGLIFAFSSQSVDWEKRMVSGLYFNVASREWTYRQLPLPAVIYRRDFHQSPDVIARLSDATGGRLFNSHRFTKHELFEFVSRDKQLAPCLPPTEASRTREQVKAFLDKHTKVILKPVDLSRGRGLCIIEKKNGQYALSDYRYKRAAETTLDGPRALDRFLDANRDFFHKYIIQKYIPLARIGSSLFDIRVVMQKASPRTWLCTGIECRVSGPSSAITNISRGGYALELEEALAGAFAPDCDIPLLKRQIQDYCFKFCAHMDSMGQHFAEFGIDVALDIHKNLWLIEANVFPSFKGFKAMNYDTYLNIRYAPLLYALSLTAFGEAAPGG